MNPTDAPYYRVPFRRRPPSRGDPSVHGIELRVPTGGGVSAPIVLRTVPLDARVKLIGLATRIDYGEGAPQRPDSPIALVRGLSLTGQAWRPLLLHDAPANAADYAAGNEDQLVGLRSYPQDQGLGFEVSVSITGKSGQSARLEAFAIVTLVGLPAEGWLPPFEAGVLPVPPAPADLLCGEGPAA